MANSLHVLINDRTFVQVTSDIMCGSTNQFNTALICLMIGTRSSDSWQKLMMDVGTAPPQLLRKIS